MKFRLRGARPVANKIVIVEIDDLAIEKLGRWPWHRDRMAELIEKILGAGAKAVGLDVVFPDPDVRVPEELARFLRERELGELLDEMDTDRVLGRTIMRRQGQLVLGWSSGASCQPAYSTAAEGPPGDPAKSRLPQNFDKFGLAITTPFDPARTPLVAAPTVVANLDRYHQVARHAGHLVGWPDPDGVNRRIPLLDNLLAGDALTDAPGWRGTYWIYLLMPLGAFAFALLLERRGALFVFAVFGLTLLLFFQLDFVLLFRRGVALPSAFVYAELTTIFTVALATRYLNDERAKRRAQEQLAEQFRLYKRLYEAGQQFNATVVLDDILRTATGFVTDALGFERCVILLRSDDEAAWRASAAGGYSDEDRPAALALTIEATDPALATLQAGADQVLRGAGEAGVDLDALEETVRNTVEDLDWIVFGVEPKILLSAIKAGGGTLEVRVPAKPTRPHDEWQSMLNKAIYKALATAKEEKRAAA
ncbi:MAG: CHASE2 domain-containing protein [Myxococcales bacterium]|nr:CHASE2 domain-containing protein [Myxococcales bacterium]